MDSFVCPDTEKPHYNYKFLLKNPLNMDIMAYVPLVSV